MWAHLSQLHVTRRSWSVVGSPVSFKRGVCFNLESMGKKCGSLGMSWVTNALGFFDRISRIDSSDLVSELCPGIWFDSALLGLSFSVCLVFLFLGLSELLSSDYLSLFPYFCFVVFCFLC